MSYVRYVMFYIMLIKQFNVYKQKGEYSHGKYAESIIYGMGFDKFLE